MSFDVEKVNGLLKKDDFVSKLKADLSEEGIIKTFGSKEISLTKEEALGFKQTLAERYKLSDEQLNVSGGKIGIEHGVHDVFEGVGHVIGGVGKGVASVVVGTGKGIGKAAWGVVQMPVSLVRDVGKGIYEGVKDGVTGGKK